MTNTTEIELRLCVDCVMVIANDDSSGVPDPEAHLDGLTRNWADPSWHLIVTDLAEVNDESPEGTCDGCGFPDEVLRGRGVAVRD